MNRPRSIFELSENELTKLVGNKDLIFKKDEDNCLIITIKKDGSERTAYIANPHSDDQHVKDCYYQFYLDYIRDKLLKYEFTRENNNE